MTDEILNFRVEELAQKLWDSRNAFFGVSPSQLPDDERCDYYLFQAESIVRFLRARKMQ